MSNLLLLVSENADDLSFATEVAESAGLTLKNAKTSKQAAEIILAESTAPVIMADVSTVELYKALEKSIQDTVGIFSDKIQSNLIHFISSKELNESEYLIQSSLFGHFIVRNFNNVKTEGQFYGRIVRATLSDRAFGLARLLSDNTKIQVIKLKLSSHKINAVDAIRSYLVAAKFQTRIATIVANAADEILMNAMYDAPIDELGKPTLTQTPRSTELKLEGKSAVEMHVGYDGQYIGISAVDNFGSLDKVKLLTHMAKLYNTEEYKVRTNSAGAGIGLATVFRFGGSLLFMSESGNKTEVIVFFKKTENYLDFKNQFRFVSTQFYF